MTQDLSPCNEPFEFYIDFSSAACKKSFNYEVLMLAASRIQVESVPWIGCFRNMVMPKTKTLDERYPHLSRFLAIQGWVEIGADEYSTSFVRALDPGGMVYEGLENYASLDEALADLDQGVKEYMEEHGI